MTIGYSKTLNYFNFMKLFQKVMLLRNNETLLLKRERLLRPTLFYLFYRKENLAFLLESRLQLRLSQFLTLSEPPLLL